MAAPWVVSDELWSRIELVLPVPPAGRTGPKPLSDRQVLQGILFVLFTGIGWEDLPQELGFGSDMICWRRLRNWQAVAVFDRLHEVLLAELNAAGQTDWSRACAETSHIRAKRGRRHGTEPGRPRQNRLETPPDLRQRRYSTGPHPHRRQPAQHHPTAAPGRRRPASARTTGRPRRKPGVLVADRGYDYELYRDQLRQRGITPLISRKRTRDTNQSVRWAVKQTLALRHQFRHLATRWEHRTDIHHGILTLATSLTCWRHLPNRMR